MELEPVGAVEGFRLSPQQRRVWTHRASVGDVPPAVCLVSVHGALDAERLRQALRRITARHEILRTRFFIPRGLQWPVQVISEASEPQVRVIDLSGLERCREEARLEAMLREEAATPFDPERGEPLRSVLLARAAGEQALILAAPALCADGWTMHNLVREIAAFCGGDADLDEEPMQYADFSEWQNELAAEEGEGPDHWRGMDLSPLSRLPQRFPASPASDGAPPEEVVWRISGERRRALEGLADACGVPLSAVLLTAWQLLLQRLTGERDLPIGEVSHGRKFPPLRSAFGPFAKVLPVRCHLDDGSRLDEALRRMAEASSENDAHQEYFSWDLVSDPAVPEPERFFPLAFELDEGPGSHRTGGALLSIRRIRCRNEPFAMRLRFCREDPGLLAELCFDPRRLQAEAVRHLAGQVEALLARIAEDPRATLSSLCSPGPEEAHLVRVELNDRGVRHPGGAALHRWVEAQASRSPEAVAIVFEGEELRYRDVDRRANRLAHHLRRRGIGPGAVVAVLLDRSPELVVSLLAVLKTGGAFVVAVPDQASARLAYVLADAAARLVLTAGRLLPVLPEGAPEAICLDRCDLSGEPEGAPEVDVAPEDLAYVVYTSGSTGRPKGVLATHRGVTNYLGYLESTYALGGGDVALQLASPDFDASVRDLLGPLAFGARVVLSPGSDARDPAALLARIERHCVTAILSLVPTLLRALIAEAPAAGAPCRSLRLVLISGEVLPAADCRRLSELVREDAVLVNQYGPTECTMTSTYHRVRCGVEGAEPAPVGRPIPNARLYVLDEALSPAPLGVPGQVHLGGPGLARGYLNLPDLTAWSFIPDPFGEEPGSRLYRTGDLARISPDGIVRFLGRLDAQVKVRGVRVELEEIETLLRRHQDVREAAVGVWTLPAGDQRLVAYAVPRRGAEPMLGEIRRFLQPQLPEPMLPTDLVLLGSLPLTRTGKVDRRLLPAPERGKLDETYLAPQTATEELLSGIWCNLLGLEKVGVESDFFELGGHSLLAAQLVARVRKVFEVELALQTLFEAPKLQSFAHAIDQALLSGKRYQMPPLRPLHCKGDLPLSFAQRRHWFLHRLQPESPLLNIASAVRLEGTLTSSALEQAFAAILRRHEVLRTGYYDVDGEPVQRVIADIVLRIPLVDLSALPEIRREEEQLALIFAESRRPFDLARPPLLRALLLHPFRGEHVLLLCMHHISTDLWSIGVLVRELAALYEEVVAGTPARLPELPAQYADFAQWQREWLMGDVLSTQLEYWTRQLADPPPPLELAPVSPPRVPTAHRGGKHPMVLSEDLAARLKALSRAEGATLFMTLLAGFQALLHCYSGREDIVVGAPFANRMCPEVEPLIGCFINAVALRVGLGGNPTFLELIGRVRRVVLQATAHQDVPFERVVEELNPDRSAGRLPLFEVVFNFQNAPLPESDLKGLRVNLLEVDTGAESKYDLTLYLRETGRRLVGTLRYDAARLEAWWVEELSENLEHLLETVVEDAGVRLADLRAALAAWAEQRASSRRKDLRESRLRNLHRIADRAQKSAGRRTAPTTAGESPLG